MTDIAAIYPILLLAFVTGISVGSFVTMASYRIPLGLDIVVKPSHCPHCEAKLTTLDLFPLVSWLAMHGKCRHCKAPVSCRYPLTELSLGITFVLLVLFYGVTIDTLFYALLATELLIIIVTDLEHFIIPDSMQIALAITAVAYDIYHDLNLEDVCVSTLTGLAIGLSLHYGYFYLRNKDALGWGDVKFLAVAGLWIPLLAFVPFVFLAGLLGTCFGLLWRVAGRGAVFPFGPALAFSLFINVLIPDILARIGL